MIYIIGLYVYTGIYIIADALESQERASDPLELELQTVVSSWSRVLGTKLRSSEKALLLAAEPPLGPHQALCIFLLATYFSIDGRTPINR